MTSVLTRKWIFIAIKTQTQRKEGHVEKKTDWSDATTRQGMTRIVGNHKKVRDGKGELFSRVYGGSVVPLSP